MRFCGGKRRALFGGETGWLVDFRIAQKFGKSGTYCRHFVPFFWGGFGFRCWEKSKALFLMF